MRAIRPKLRGLFTAGQRSSDGALAVPVADAPPTTTADAPTTEPAAAPTREPPGPPRFAVEQLTSGAERKLVLRGSFELEAVGTFDAVVARLWETDPRKITVDLRGLTFIDSSGLWSITSLHKWCTRESIRFALIRGPDAVHRVFELTGLSDVLPFVSP